MKKRIGLTTLICAALSIVSVTTKGAVLLGDNFESYPVNSWPSADWTGFGGNDSNHAVNRIETDPTGASNQVFRLTGVVGAFWAAGANRDVAFTDRYRVDLRVYNGNESIPSSGHQVRAGMQLKGGGHHWASGVGRDLFRFEKNGTVTASGNILQTYETLRWYDVSIEYNRVSATDLFLSYWIDGVDRGTFLLPVYGYELDLDHIELTASAGSVYYDDLQINSLPSSGVVPEPSSLIVWVLLSTVVGGFCYSKRRKRQ